MQREAQGRAESDSFSIFLRLLVAVSAIISVGLIVAYPPVIDSPVHWAILGSLALIAQFLPLNLSRGGVRMVFALPFVAAFAATSGPSAALLIDVLAACVGAVVLMVREPVSSGGKWLTANLAISAVSVFAGGAFMALVAFGPLNEPTALVARCLVFLIVYGIVNFLLVTGLDAIATGRAAARTELAMLSLGAQSVALYALLGLAVSILIAENHVALVPLTLAPVLALRSALMYRTKRYDNYYGTIAALNLMLQRAHPYTHGHLERVAVVAEDVARQLGLSRSRARLVREAAILHDIGKIAVDEEILDKPAKLTSEEFDHVKRHSEWGAEILQPVREFAEIVPWIRHHHERPDGTGYPDRLTDPEIPIESKIIAVVDAYDAMTGSEKRSYRESVRSDEALQELERCSGRQFDPRVVAAFKSVVVGGRR